MKPKSLWILAAAGLLLVWGAGSPVAADPYDFGAIPVGQKAVGTFNITNNWSMPIQVDLTLTESDPLGYSLDPTASLSSKTVEVAAGETVPFEIIFAPGEETDYAATFTAVYGWTTLMTLELSGIGSAPAVSKTKPVAPISIGQCNTGVVDQAYGDGMLSDKVDACFETPENRRGALRCVSRLSWKLKKQRVLSYGEVRALKRCAVRAQVDYYLEKWRERHSKHKKYHSRSRKLRWSRWW